MDPIAKAASRGRRAVLLGALINAVLAAVKMTAGVLGNSSALIADSVESAMDVVSSALIWMALKYAEKPPDDDHPYGHGKVESLAAIGGSLVLIGAGLTVASLSVKGLLHSHIQATPVPASFTLVVLVVVIATKEILFRFLVRESAEAGSSAIETDAWHHRSDALTSIAAFIGIGIAIIGGPAWADADKWAALFSCAIIVFNGIRMFRSAFHEIMDAQASGHLIQKIEILARTIPGVESSEKCRVRKSGLSYIADIHIRVPGDLSVRGGHAISHAVKKALLEANLRLSDVIVHTEPADHPPVNDVEAI